VWLVAFLLQNSFPELMQYVRVRVVEMLDHVLATYNPRAGQYTEKLWKREGRDSCGDHRAQHCRILSSTLCYGAD
jgi:hypothetical protein